MLEYFYFEIFRKTVIGFGTLFNNIWIKQRNKSGQIVSEIKVPIEYGPTQKFLARLEQSPEDLNNPVRITLPRLSFEVIDFTYDPDRKGAITQTFIAPVKTDNSVLKRAYLPVPYNLGINLNIMTKNNDDMWQILEQILPYFQPSFTITIELLNEIGEKRDIPFILNTVNVEDNYEGNYEDRRVLIGTLGFTAKTYLFGPSSQPVGGEIINKVTINFKSSDSNGVNEGGSIQVTPIAGVNYTNNVISTTSKDITNFDVVISVQDASSLSIGDFITINTETFRILSITGNDLAVQRGAYGTTISNHTLGTDVKLIVNEDNDLVVPGDPYGTNIQII